MYSYRFIILLLLASSCKAGPLMIAIIPLIEAVSEVAATAIASSSVAAAFGVAPCGVMFGEAIVVNGALYYGSAAVGVGALAGAGAGGIAAGVKAGSHGAPVTDPAVSRSIMSSLSVQSVASVVSVASRQSVEYIAATSAAYQTWLSLKASMDTHAPSTPKSKNSDPFDFKTLLNVASISEAKPASKPAQSITVPSPTVPAPTVQHPKPVTPAPSSSIAPPPGTPYSTLPPGNRPPEVPAGVPDYNFRLCQYDIIKMGQNKVNFNFDQPGPQSIRVDNIPATCMVLSNVLLGNPDLGPHPIPMGSASLQWNNIHTDTMSLIRRAFGVDNQTTSTHYQTTRV